MLKQALPFLACVALTVASGVGHAQPIGMDQVPKPVLDKFQASYPEAKELQAESVTHFRAPLIKLTYTKGEEQNVQYFRPNGSRLINGYIIDEDELPPDAPNNLKTEFPDYRIKSVTLIVNPNGPGREYEVDLSAGGAAWEVVVDDSGTLLSKTNE